MFCKQYKQYFCFMFCKGDINNELTKVALCFGKGDINND